MSIKSFAAKLFAKQIKKKVDAWSSNPIKTQQKVFRDLLKNGLKTQFGKDHGFNTITSHEEFIKRVPVRDYEALKLYVERVVEGEENILWPGKPLYFAKTSGTTSGVKYIPITEALNYKRKTAYSLVDYQEFQRILFLSIFRKTDYQVGKPIA